MAILTRVLQKIFGSTADTAELGVIGSEDAGAAATSSNLDTIQSLSQFLAGLFAITSGGTGLPKLQDFNSLFLLITSQLKYLYQAGIPEYHPSENYYANISIVQSGGIVYVSKTGTSPSPNVGNTPSSSPTNWRPIGGKTLITSPATESILTILDGKTLTVNKTLTLDGTDGETLNIDDVLTSPSQRLDNAGLLVSVAANALTIALKQADGATDPAAGQGRVKIAFRGTTLTLGSFVQRTLAAASSIVVPSGATLGQVSGVAGYLYLYALDNAGTIELAISGTDCWADDTLQSTTVLDTSSDSATALYSTTARTNVAIRFLGTILASEATAGTWATAPTKVSVYPCARNLTPIKASSLRSAAVAIVSNTEKTFASVTLPPGTWELKAHGGVIGAGGAIFTLFDVCISLTTNTEPATDTEAVPSSGGEYRNRLPFTSSANVDQATEISSYLVTISSATTFYLVLFAIFSSGTGTGFGEIEARFIHN